MNHSIDILPQRASGTATEAGATVILKEADLDCDLATAIARIRATEGTRASRILVIAPETGEGRRKAAGASSEASSSDLALTLAQAARRGELAALEPLGRRTLGLLTCLERFAEETRWALDELLESIAEEPRARLLNQVKVLQEIQGWTQAVADDLRLEAKGAAEGFRPVDSEQLWNDLIGELEPALGGTRVSLEPGDAGTICWARVADLAEAFAICLRLVTSRVGGRGNVVVSASREDGWLCWTLRGQGEPRAVDAPELVARLRRLVLEVHGGRLEADELGPHGTGLRIGLPVRS